MEQLPWPDWLAMLREPYMVQPEGVILGPNGDFYGTLGVGGDLQCGFNDIGCGTVFKLTP